MHRSSAAMLRQARCPAVLERPGSRLRVLCDLQTWKRAARAHASLPSPTSQIHVGHVTARALSSSASASQKQHETLDFQDSRLALEHKSTLELLRFWLIFKTCSVGWIVRNCDSLYTRFDKILPSFLMRRAMRLTFFGHFCAGESVEELKPKMQTLHKYGIGGILDYAAEAKDESSPVLEVQHVAQTAEQETVGAPESAPMYDYQGEAAADANAEIFFDAVRAVRDATPSGFAAIKISGLGNPMLLERMSQSLIELADFFAKLQREAEPEAKKRTTPFLLLDRSFQISYDVFAKGWRKWFEDPGDEKLREIFDSLDHRGTGKIDYLDWTNSMRLSELRALVLTCRDKGPLYRAALNEEEIELYFNMIRRVQAIFDLARDLGVRVMVDAEWCDIQPAINHIVLFLQRNYNRGDVPIVFQTYQTYLKGMQAQVKRDLERSKREGWRFGAKVVRGAYLVSEREKANQRGVESPVCETYEDTEENFHTSIDLILTHNHDAPDLPINPVHRPAVGPGELSEAEILVASHNRGTVEFTVKRMQELGKDYNHVHFGQLLGMADHLTFTLGMNGYKAYKYVPYGPIDEVVPYLIRRTQENSAILGSPGVFEERAMVTRELRRRSLRF